MFEWLLSSLGGNGFPLRRGGDGTSTSAARLASKATAVPSLRSALARITAELGRARRYEHPLCLLVVTMHPGGRGPAGDDEVERAGPRSGPPPVGARVPHPVGLLAAWLLSEVLRESDIVSYDPVAEHFVIVLPEAAGEGGRQAARRIGRVMREPMNIHVRAGLARFPEEGLTVAQLLERAEAAWTHGPLEMAPRDEDGEPTKASRRAPDAEPMEAEAAYVGGDDDPPTPDGRSPEEG